MLKFSQQLKRRKQTTITTISPVLSTNALGWLIHSVLNQIFPYSNEDNVLVANGLYGYDTKVSLVQIPKTGTMNSPIYDSDPAISTSFRKKEECTFVVQVSFKAKYELRAKLFAEKLEAALKEKLDGEWKNTNTQFEIELQKII